MLSSVPVSYQQYLQQMSDVQCRGVLLNCMFICVYHACVREKEHGGVRGGVCQVVSFAVEEKVGWNEGENGESQKEKETKEEEKSMHAHTSKTPHLYKGISCTQPCAAPCSEDADTVHLFDLRRVRGRWRWLGWGWRGTAGICLLQTQVGTQTCATKAHHFTSSCSVPQMYSLEVALLLVVFPRCTRWGSFYFFLQGSPAVLAGGHFTSCSVPQLYSLGVVLLLVVFPSCTHWGSFYFL